MASTINRFASLQLAHVEDGSYDEVSKEINLIISRLGQFGESRLTSRELEFAFQKVFKSMADKRSPNTPTANHLAKSDYLINFLTRRPIKEIDKEPLNFMRFKDQFILNGFIEKFRFVDCYVIDMTHLQANRDYNLNTLELSELFSDKQTLVYVYIIRDETVAVFGKPLSYLRILNISKQELQNILSEDFDVESILFDSNKMTMFEQQAMPIEIRSLPGQQMTHDVNAWLGERALHISELDTNKTINIKVADAIVEFRSKNYNSTESDYADELKFIEEFIIILSDDLGELEPNSLIHVNLDYENFEHLGDTFRFDYVIVPKDKMSRFAFTRTKLADSSRIWPTVVCVDAFDSTWKRFEKYVPQHERNRNIIRESRRYQNADIRDKQLPIQVIRSSSTLFYSVLDASNMYYIEDKLFGDDVLKKFESSKIVPELRIFITGSAVDGTLFRINDLTENFTLRIIEVNVEYWAPSLRGFSIGHNLRIFSTVIPDTTSGLAVRARLAPNWEYNPSPRESREATVNSSRRSRRTEELLAGNPYRELEAVSKWFSRMENTIRTRRFGALPLSLERLGTVHKAFERILREFNIRDVHANEVWSEFEEFFGQFGESLELAREALKNRIKCDELSLAEQFRLDELLSIDVVDCDMDISRLRQQLAVIKNLKKY